MTKHNNYCGNYVSNNYQNSKNELKVEDSSKLRESIKHLQKELNTIKGVVNTQGK